MVIVKKKPLQNNHGFTVIELLIATAVFSVVLLVFVFSFIRISEMFYKGVNLANTQETARNAVQSVADDIQFYANSPQTDTLNQGYFCVGGHRYSFKRGAKYIPNSATNYGLIKETTNCVSPSSQAPNFANAQELLDPGMSLNNLVINCDQFGLCFINMHIVFYGSDPAVLLPNAQDPNAHCSGSYNSTQYCATADYSSTVLQKF